MLYVLYNYVIGRLWKRNDIFNLLDDTMYSMTFYYIINNLRLDRLYIVHKDNWNIFKSK